MQLIILKMENFNNLSENEKSNTFSNDNNLALFMSSQNNKITHFDAKETKTEIDQNKLTKSKLNHDLDSSSVYNLPWDNEINIMKFKINSVLPEQKEILTNFSHSMSNQIESPTSTTSLPLPPPLPTVPPPQTPQRKDQHKKNLSNVSSASSLNTSSNASTVNFNDQQKIKLDQNDDTQVYCAPWDSKLQEEMLKLMAKKQQQQNSLKTNEKHEINLNKNINKRNSINSNKVLDEVPLSPNNEYSPPWENKNILKNLASVNLSSLNKQSSANITSKSIHSQQVSSVSSIINQFNRNTRASIRSTTSSSSSTRSSTSSLSTDSSQPINTNGSCMHPPLQPPTAPPPPPPSTQSFQINGSFSLINSSPNSCNQNVLATMVSLNNNKLITNNIFSNESSQKNNNGNFQNIMSVNGNTKSLDKLTINLNKNDVVNDNIFNSSDTDSTKQLYRHNSARCPTSNQFQYPPHHFQSLTSNHQQLSDLKLTQIAVPLTATFLLTSQNSSNNSLSKNLMIPLSLQQNSLINSISSGVQSPKNHMASLERQIWYHGPITRKQAENILNNKPVGSFLVRQSESGSSNDFSLSLMSGSGCVHMRICLKNGEGFILGQCSQPFPNIIKMIEHYSKVEVPIKGAQHVKLYMPTASN